MKIRYVIILLVGLFILSLVVDRNSGTFSTDRVRWMAALDWTNYALGIAIAVISAFRLLQLGLQGAKLPQVMPAGVALLAGLSLFQRYWAIPIALAGVLMCWLIVEHLKPSEKKPAE